MLTLEKIKRHAEALRDPRNCLSYWFPKLQGAFLPVPRTEIFVGDEKMPSVAIFNAVEEICDEIGYPCFLRTGYTSVKFKWSQTCHLKNRDDIPANVSTLIEYSDLFSLPSNVWAARELLPTKPIATFPAYHDMPLALEYRCFVEDGRLVCVHPYWSLGSICEGYAYAETPVEVVRWYLHSLDIEPHFNKRIRELAISASEAVEGRWSVDMLWTERGWSITDMALADCSWHWPECEAWA